MSTNAWIKEVTTENAGGGCMVDFIHLKDGSILGINDECCVLYKNMEEFYEATSDEKPAIHFPRRTTVLVHQTLYLVYEVEVVGGITIEKVQEEMSQLGYPDASSMTTESTWYYPDISQAEKVFLEWSS